MIAIQMSELVKKKNLFSNIEKFLMLWESHYKNENYDRTFDS